MVEIVGFSNWVAKRLITNAGLFSIWHTMSDTFAQERIGQQQNSCHVWEVWLWLVLQIVRAVYRLLWLPVSLTDWKRQSEMDLLSIFLLHSPCLAEVLSEPVLGMQSSRAPRPDSVTPFFWPRQTRSPAFLESVFLPAQQFGLLSTKLMMNAQCGREKHALKNKTSHRKDG